MCIWTVIPQRAAMVSIPTTMRDKGLHETIFVAKKYPINSLLVAS